MHKIACRKLAGAIHAVNKDESPVEVDGADSTSEEEAISSEIERVHDDEDIQASAFLSSLVISSEEATSIQETNSEDAEEELATRSSEWLEPWAVPWGGKEVTVGILAWLFSFIGSSLVVQLLCVRLGWTPWRESLDEQAVFLAINQVIRTAAGLGIVYAVVKPFQPLPPNFFSFDARKPLRLEDGWLLWGVGGFIFSCIAVQLSAVAQAALQGGQEIPREEADALVQLLPIIGASPLSTGSLVVVAGICAPLLEETIFRGFLMTSLSKWMPIPLAAVLSAGAFAGAHLTPSDFPKLAMLGLVLGLSYAKTKNLLTPIFIHSLWNSGIIVLLTILRMQGYDIKELL